MFKLLASLLMQLFFSKPPGVPAGMPPPDSSTFLPALDIAFMALFVIPTVVMQKHTKVSRLKGRYPETRYAKDDSTFSL